MSLLIKAQADHSHISDDGNSIIIETQLFCRWTDYFVDLCNKPPENIDWSPINRYLDLVNFLKPISDALVCNLAIIECPVADNRDKNWKSDEV